MLASSFTLIPYDRYNKQYFLLNIFFSILSFNRCPTLQKKIEHSKAFKGIHLN